MTVVQRAQRHFAYHRLTHRSVPGQCICRHTQHLLFGFIAVGHETPFEPDGTASHIGADLGNPAAGAGFGSGQPLAAGDVALTGTNGGSYALGNLQFGVADINVLTIPVAGGIDIDSLVLSIFDGAVEDADFLATQA